VRRALLPLWPAFSRVYGLHPFDVERLTPDEVNGYLADLNRMLEEV
jgi:hypothetical protein